MEEVYKQCLDCDVNYVRENIPGDCCGKCVKDKCVHNGLPRNISDTWYDDQNKCTQFKCIKVGDDTAINTIASIPCDDVSDCPADRLSLAPNGCCNICLPPDARSMFLI